MKPDLVPGTAAYEAYLASLTGPAPVAHERKAQVRRTQTAAPGECWTCSAFNEQTNKCRILRRLQAFCVFHSGRQEKRRQGQEGAGSGRWLGEMDDEGTVGQR